MPTNQSHISSPLLGEKDAALFLNLSVKTLQNWRVSGRGPSFVKIGRRVQYRLTDLEEYVAKCVRCSTSDRREPLR
ncbi:MAG TPA: helix-turn-helix domain-containing protein [Thermoanaerobaculia bacterium]|nr:helix-turn-helix domain-containing protein [Thermoanaerobaculia bacterium]